MWVQGIGKIVYNPSRPGLKKTWKQSPWWTIAEIDDEIGRYYRWWVMKRFGLRLQAPAWGNHITIVSNKDKIASEFHTNWKMFEKQQFKFQYSVDIEQHWKFWTLSVKSDVIDTIRKDLGLPINNSLHITIGRME